ncbi:hypothetical protein [Stenomitos frigidus]|uniref:DUF1415 domain-containing protein n=1 Tax=Stenomitos frigidus ULC18 TaxID=2107698 RepID=A0A2T1E2N2_9CYAN|nr:hypothetical protein [Stenomitos frigidus]PSB26980.1 hypothetical protein C7B82_17635 [Stenomitos frigidus ULC18]
MSLDREASIIEKMIQYLETVLEQPHPVFGGLPICPFSKKARLQNKIFYKVIALAMDQLQAGSELRQAIASFHESKQHDVLVVISPDHDALTVEQVQAFVEQLNDRIAPMRLTAFGGHPQDPFNVQGVFTRQEPFINLTIQSMTILQAASEQLARTSYYQHWSAENLRQVGFHNRSAVAIERQMGD